MERDFLGLGSKTSPITVEEETRDNSKDSAPSRGMKWSFSNKVLAAPQFLSFSPSQEGRPRKSAYDHLVPSGTFVPTSTPDVSDSNRNPPFSSVQGLRMFPKHNQTISVSMAVPAFHSHFTPGGKSFISSTIINPQNLGGVPIMAPPVSVLPAPSHVVVTDDTKSSSKPLGSHAQLTIFYAGSVCVYDNISPEKAQAIMLLAGNDGSPVPLSKQQLPIPDPSSEPVACSNGASASEDGAAKTTPHKCDNQTSPSRTSCSVLVPNAVVPAVDLPQTRKASLARFLEKRKERRVMNTSPYCISSSLSSAASSAHLH